MAGVRDGFLAGKGVKVLFGQPPGFEDHDHPDKVYRVVKALYGLHQAPRAWYETLATYLLENGFHRGLQVKQKKDGIFISQDKYVVEILRKFGLTKGKPASTPIDTEKPLLKNPDGEDVDVHTYRSMIGSLMYLTSSRPDIMFASNDVTKLQALVAKKKVVITEATISDALRLDDVEGVDRLPNEEIFAELARMGYEKPSTKLTFYKAFFSSQWKFLIHTILQTLSAKRTSWNEFSSAMASAVICLSIGRKFNFSKYIFESLVRNVDNSSKFYMYPRVGKGFSGVETPLFEGMLVAREIEEQGAAEEQVQDDVDDAAAQGDDTAVEGDDVHEPSIPFPTPPTPPPQQSQNLPSTSQVQHTPPHSQPPPQAQPQAVDFPMSLLQEALDACAALTRRVEHLEYDKVAQALEVTKLKRRVKKLEIRNKVKVLKLRRLKKVGTSQRIESSDDNVMEDASNQERMTDALMVDKEDEKKTEEAMGAGDDQVKGRQAEIYKIDMDHASKVLSMQEDEPKVQEVVDVVTTAKLITEVVSAVSESVPAASTTIAATEPQVPAATITAALVRVSAASTRKRKGVVIRDPEEESTAIKPQQVEMDEEYARKLHEKLNEDIEWNKDIDWNAAIDHVKQRAKEDPYVQRYQVIKKRPQTEAQAQKNIMMYLKNVAGFRLDYFKGMSYDDICPIFEAKFNSNIEFLLKTKEQLEEKENRAIESINETPA
nr:hypothetical protein [Tanacetum cinerariifolium]